MTDVPADTPTPPPHWLDRPPPLWSLLLAAAAVGALLALTGATVAHGPLFTDPVAGTPVPISTTQGA